MLLGSERPALLVGSESELLRREVAAAIHWSAGGEVARSEEELNWSEEEVGWNLRHTPLHTTQKEGVLDFLPRRQHQEEELAGRGTRRRGVDTHSHSRGVDTPTQAT